MKLKMYIGQLGDNSSYMTFGRKYFHFQKDFTLSSASLIRNWVKLKIKLEAIEKQKLQVQADLLSINRELLTKRIT